VNRAAQELGGTRALREDPRMRILIVLLAAALAMGCGSSDTAGGSSGGSSGGSTGSVASGTATLTGTGAFAAQTVFFRWADPGDGGASRAYANIVFIDASATCAQVTAGLNTGFGAFRELGLQPRVADGGLVSGHYSYSESTGAPADGMNLGWFGATQGETPLPSAYDALSADLTSVADDAISGRFEIDWSADDGGATPPPLQGTFSAPLCDPRP
jgi:hypothetical protein